MVGLLKIAVHLLADILRFVILLFRTTQSIQTENLFLRRQLALFIERGVRPRRVDAATRVSLAILARMFDSQKALVVVQPATMIRWRTSGTSAATRPLPSPQAGPHKQPPTKK